MVRRLSDCVDLLVRVALRLDDLAAHKESPLILVCQSGARSGDACKKLEKLGFAKTHNLSGGIAAWRTAGLPLKKGKK